MILGRAASDLLFYGCALAQAALAIFTNICPASGPAATERAFGKVPPLHR